MCQCAASNETPLVTGEMMINSLLAEACWGTWNEAAHGRAVGNSMDGPKLLAAASWTPALREPQVERPSGMISYSELLEDVLKVSKTARVHLKTRFTEPGQPGESFRPAYERLLQALSLPPNVELPHAPEAIGKGRRFLLPCFFELVLALDRAGRDFSIVFRTFGVDLPEVAQEWNSFCTGVHPCYPGVRLDGSSSRGIDRTLSLPENSGAWYRYGIEAADAADNITLSLVDGKTGVVVLAEGAVGCAQAIDAKLGDPGSATLGLRDYYPYWAAQKESDTAGKLLLVDTSPDAACHHIFFDDNIERDRAHIVDCRDSRTGKSLPYTSTKGRWLVKAEPLHSIVDPQYFIRMVHSCETALRAGGLQEVSTDQSHARRRLEATRTQIMELQAELGLVNGLNA
jgi:hypothetical protein